MKGSEVQGSAQPLVAEADSLNKEETLRRGSLFRPPEV